ncbi:energy transducer TonB [Thalassomonas haliotis]|uniref:Energy transducer TonB n=1 Tax=Thalassomonas haliotis TaxID=485448 RepID=A0ABY7V8P4_9GAMM|nr:energy transducer TonB [Thalassomonas haliotis]WDE10024.1 energy transducer TonB [Thalassomonas haliotis]
MSLKKALLSFSFSAMALSLPSFANFADTQSVSTPAPTAKVKQIATITDAVAQHRGAPRYPADEARSGREGWAVLSYVIETDGSVSNILVEESSGRRSFDRAAVKAAKKWRYQPAIENGKPVQQCHNRVKIDFSIKGANSSVSRKFLRRYKDILALIEKDDLVLAKEKIDQLKTFKQWRLSEEMYFSLARASYARKTGDKALELASLKRALAADSNRLNPEFQLSTLQHIYNLNLSQNRLHDALATYDKITSTAKDESQIKPFKDSKNAVEDFIHGGQDIILNGALKENNAWNHTLVRKAFSLTNIKGSLHKLDVRCANKRHVFTVENNTSWEIPESWQRCSVYVYGEKKTEFQLIEHPVAKT